MLSHPQQVRAMNNGWRSRIVGHGEEAPDQLLAHPANWRLHPKAQQEALASVLSEIGFIQDIIVNQRTGHVLDGHLRVELALSRGEPAVPVVYVDLSEAEEEIALATFDPISTLAAADKEKLAELTERARQHAQSSAVRDLLSHLAQQAGVRPAVNGAAGDEQDTTSDDVDALRERWGVVAGQLWEIPSKRFGQRSHRLLCGDAADPDALGRLVRGSVIDALITDPPYGCNLLTERGKLGSYGSRIGLPGRDYAPVAGDDQPFDPSPWLAYPMMVVLWGANWFCSRLPDASCWLVWDKRDGTASNDMADAELAWTNLPGPTRLFSHRWMGMIRDSERGEQRLHPTQKPVALVEWVFDQCRLSPGETVLDPYLGSGTTIVAAERRGHVALGMELSPAYVAVSLERLSLLGLEPQLSEGAR